MAETTRKNARKSRQGTVTSDKMDKTIVIRVDRTMKHAQYKKIVSASSKIYAHDEKNEAGVGDLVRVVETRPLSKQKRWRLVEIVTKAE